VKCPAIVAVLVVGACVISSACLRPARERAERDLEVGHAQAAGLRLDVAGGLAAVRSVDPGVVSLWAGAPSLRLTLQREVDAPAAWQLKVANCMPEAELAVPPAAEIESSERWATRCSWQLRLPDVEPVELTLRTPDARELGAFRFAVMSDVQSAMDRVGDVFATINQDQSVRFVLSTGDLTEQGAEEEFQQFEAELGQLDVPFFTTLGNHELGQSPTRFHEFFGRGNFHFVFRGVHFTLLDSASAGLDPLVYEWLEDWLARGQSRTHVVAMHVPPLDPVGLRNGGFASRNEAARLLALLAGGGVDLTLYGHLHSYYRFQNAGIEAHISGGAGALPERLDGIGRHYLTVDVDVQAGVLSTQVVRVD
jgi:Icc protein